MEYISAYDIQDIINDIEPYRYNYYENGIGVAERMVLDKQQEIADMLKELEVVEVEDEE